MFVVVQKLSSYEAVLQYLCYCKAVSEVEKKKKVKTGSGRMTNCLPGSGGMKTEND